MAAKAGPAEPVVRAATAVTVRPVPSARQVSATVTVARGVTVLAVAVEASEVLAAMQAESPMVGPATPVSTVTAVLVALVATLAKVVLAA